MISYLLSVIGGFFACMFLNFLSKKFIKDDTKRYISIYALILLITYFTIGILNGIIIYTASMALFIYYDKTKDKRKKNK
jgi:hypothetical protein